MDDKLRSILVTIVDAQLELSAAISEGSLTRDIGVLRTRLERARRDLEPSIMDMLPGFQGKP